MKIKEIIKSDNIGLINHYLFIYIILLKLCQTSQPHLIEYDGLQRKVLEIPQIKHFPVMNRNY
jgi:hypothetical protein